MNKISLNEEQKNVVKAIALGMMIYTMMYAITMATYAILEYKDDIIDWIKEKLPKKKKRFNAHREVDLDDYDFDDFDE